MATPYLQGGLIRRSIAAPALAALLRVGSGQRASVVAETGVIVVADAANFGDDDLHALGQFDQAPRLVWREPYCTLVIDATRSERTPRHDPDSTRTQRQRPAKKCFTPGRGARRSMLATGT